MTLYLTSRLDERPIRCDRAAIAGVSDKRVRESGISRFGAAGSEPSGAADQVWWVYEAAPHSQRLA
jgi:hypothetical protein